MKKTMILIILSVFLFGTAYGAVILNHNSNVTVTPDWIPAAWSGNITFNVTNIASSVDNITKIEMYNVNSTADDEFNITSLYCPAGWSASTSERESTKDNLTDTAECSNGELLNGTSAGIILTVDAKNISEGSIFTGPWTVITSDPNVPSNVKNAWPVVGIDAKGPVITFNSPTDNIFYVPGLIDINITATDGEIELNNSSAQVTVNCTTSNLVILPNSCNTNLSSCNFSTQFNASENTTITTPYENCSITVSASDEFGNLGTSSINILLDEFGPTIDLITPSNNSEIQSGTNITFNVSDPAGEDDVWYSLDSGANISINGTRIIDTTGWSLGGHTIEIWANDSLGNVNDEITGFNGSNTLVVVIDDVVPNVTITEPTSTWYGDSIFVNTTVTDDNTVDSVTAIFNSSVVVLTNDIGTDFWTGTVDSSLIAEGNYTLVINAQDEAGNVNNTENVTNVALDHTGPIITLVTPLTEVTKKENEYFEVNVTDAIGITGDCNVILDDEDLGDISYNISDNTCSGELYISGGVDSGSNKLLNITSIDSLGNLGEVTILLSVNPTSGKGGRSGGGSNDYFAPLDEGLALENEIPKITEPEIDNIIPFVGEIIECLPGKYSDKDGDTKVGDMWRWYVNGKRVVGEVDNTLELDNSFLEADEITCSESATDGMHYTPWVESSNVAVVRIDDTIYLPENSLDVEDGTSSAPSGITGAFIGGILEDNVLTALIVISFFGVAGTISVFSHFKRNRKMKFKVK